MSGRTFPVYTFEQVLERDLPPAPAVVYDVEGAFGGYSSRLARQGYSSVLVIPSLKSLEYTTWAKETHSGRILRGDWRAIPAEDESADAILLMSSLVRLPERSDRTEALREAHRVLKPQGVLFAHLSRLTLDLWRCAPGVHPELTEAHWRCPDDLCLEFHEVGFGPLYVYPCASSESDLLPDRSLGKEDNLELIGYLWNAMGKADKNGGSLSWMAVGIRR